MQYLTIAFPNFKEKQGVPEIGGSPHPSKADVGKVFSPAVLNGDRVTTPVCKHLPGIYYLRSSVSAAGRMIKT